MLENYGDMLTIDDICEILQIGKNAAYNLLRTNELKSFRIGRSWKIPKASMIEYVTRKCFGQKM